MGAGRARCAFVRSPERTRTTLTVIDPERGRDTHVKEEGTRAGAAIVREAVQAVEKLARTGKGRLTPLVAFCGSCPPGVSPAMFGGMMRRASDAGALVALDASDEHLRAGVRPAAERFPQLWIRDQRV